MYLPYTLAFIAFQGDKGDDGVEGLEGSRGEKVIIMIDCKTTNLIFYSQGPPGQLGPTGSQGKVGHPVSIKGLQTLTFDYNYF